MANWIEFAVREEQFDLIINCLESKSCESKNYLEIERYLYLIEDLNEQKFKYQQKLLKAGG